VELLRWGSSRPLLAFPLKRSGFPSFPFLPFRREATLAYDPAFFVPFLSICESGARRRRGSYSPLSSFLLHFLVLYGKSRIMINNLPLLEKPKIPIPLLFFPQAEAPPLSLIPSPSFLFFFRYPEGGVGCVGLGGWGGWGFFLCCSRWIPRNGG